MRIDDPSRQPGKSTEVVADAAPAPSSGPWVALAVVLVLATSLALASVSTWLVGPYLGLMAWLLLAPGRARAESPDMPRLTTRPVGESDPPLAYGGAPEVGLEGASEPPAAEPPSDEASAPKPRKGRGKGRGRKAPRDPAPPPEPVSVSWVRVGPGQFVRVEASQAEDSPELAEPPASPESVEPPGPDPLPSPEGSAIAPVFVPELPQALALQVPEAPIREVGAEPEPLPSPELQVPAEPEGEPESDASPPPETSPTPADSEPVPTPADASPGAEEEGPAAEATTVEEAEEETAPPPGEEPGFEGFAEAPDPGVMIDAEPCEPAPDKAPGPGEPSVEDEEGAFADSVGEGGIPQAEPFECSHPDDAGAPPAEPEVVESAEGPEFDGESFPIPTLDLASHPSPRRPVPRPAWLPEARSRSSRARVLGRSPEPSRPSRLRARPRGHTGPRRVRSWHGHRRHEPRAPPDRWIRRPPGLRPTVRKIHPLGPTWTDAGQAA